MTFLLSTYTPIDELHIRFMWCPIRTVGYSCHPTSELPPLTASCNFTLEDVATLPVICPWSSDWFPVSGSVLCREAYMYVGEIEARSRKAYVWDRGTVSGSVRCRQAYVGEIKATFTQWRRLPSSKSVGCQRWDANITWMCKICPRSCKLPYIA